MSHRNALRSLSTLCLLLLTISSSQASGILHVPVSHKFYQRTENNIFQPSDINARDTIQVEFNKSAQWFSSYTVDVTAGTPPQKMRLAVDSGSSDIMLTNYASCGYPCENAWFTASLSNTLSYLSGTYRGSLAGASQVGSWILDNFSIGSISLNQIPMAWKVYNSDTFPGILGIGFDVNEGTSNCNYGNFLDQLVSQKVIPRKVWSFYGNDKFSTEANMIFGGYDEARFLPPLNIIYYHPASKGSTTMVVTLNDIALGNSSGTYPIQDSHLPLGTVFDTGNGNVELPPNVYDVVYAALRAYKDPTYGDRVSCGVGIGDGEPKGSVNFRFDGQSSPTIFVDYSELAKPYVNPRTGAVYNDGHGVPICYLGISRASSTATVYNIGLPFMRSAYLVFDQEEYSVGIAETKFNVTSSSYVALSTALGSNPYKASLPSTSRYCFTSTASTPLATTVSTSNYYYYSSYYGYSSYSYNYGSYYTSTSSSSPSPTSTSSSSITSAAVVPFTTAVQSSANALVTLPSSCSTLVSAFIACDIDVRWCASFDTFLGQNQQNPSQAISNLCANPHSVQISTRGDGVLEYNSGQSITFAGTGTMTGASRTGNGVGRVTPAVRLGGVESMMTVVHVFLVSIVVAVAA